MPRKYASGAEHHLWRGGIQHHTAGYRLIKQPEHHRASKAGYVFEHILVAEKALGKPLPPSAQVHHVDGNRANNEPKNLVICEDEAYHKLLHQRARAYKATGNVNAVQCVYCSEWELPPYEGMTLRKGTNGSRHKACAAKYRRERKEKLKPKEGGPA